MRRRKFVKNSLIAAIGTLFASATVGAHDSEEAEPQKLLPNHEIQYEEFAKDQSYMVQVVNIHTYYYQYHEKTVFNIDKENLYPFKFEQGEYAILLKPVSGGFVKTHLYELISGAYELIGENISSAKSSTMSWPAVGIEVNIINSK